MLGVSGFASFPNVLKNAGAEDADMTLPLPILMEMVTCQVAHSIFILGKLSCEVSRIWTQSMLTYTGEIICP